MDNLSVALSIGLKALACGLFISPEGLSDGPLDQYELVFVRSGTLSLWEDDVRIDVPAGHTLLLHTKQHRRIAGPLGRNLSFYWVKFDIGQTRLGKRGMQIPKLARLQRPDCVAELFHRYLDDQAAGRLDNFYAGLLLLQILCEVARGPVEPEVSKGAVLAGRAEAYVTHHIADKLSTARIARSLRVNPDYLNRVFRSVHKITITEFINRRKVADAAKLLRETTDSIADIASALGYTTAGYFGRVFERYNGASPGEYRRQNTRHVSEIELTQNSSLAHAASPVRSVTARQPAPAVAERSA